MRRNIFENKKYVEEYRASDIAAELGLDRMKLIRMAQLLGSDYSPGVAGIGAPQPLRGLLVPDLKHTYWGFYTPHAPIFMSLSWTASAALLRRKSPVCPQFRGVNTSLSIFLMLPLHNGLQEASRACNLRWMTQNTGTVTSNHK